MQMPCFLSSQDSELVTTFANKYYDSNINVSDVLSKIVKSFPIDDKSELCIPILNAIRKSTMTNQDLNNYLTKAEIAVLICDYMCK